MKLQFGCECQDCNIYSNCGKSIAPVTKLVERNGKRIKVCSRCDLSSDKLIKLLVNKNTPAKALIDYDALGAMCIMSEISEQSKSRKRKSKGRTN